MRILVFCLLAALFDPSQSFVKRWKSAPSKVNSGCNNAVLSFFQLASSTNNFDKESISFSSSDFMRADVVIDKNETGIIPTKDPKIIIEENLKALEKQKYIDMMSKRFGGKLNKKELEENYDAVTRRGDPYDLDIYDSSGFNQSAEFMDDPRSRPLMFESEMFRMSNSSLQELTNSSDPLVLRFLKDVYIGAEDDSPRRKQARYVLRSITFLSFAIGFAFTALWYIAPGKFISYRGDRDFSEKYSTYVPPGGEGQDTNDFVNQEYLQQYRRKTDLFQADQGGLVIRESSPLDEVRPKSEYLDDGVGVPENDMPRISLDNPRRPPSGRTMQF